jgi:hypothetical protein
MLASVPYLINKKDSCPSYVNEGRIHGHLNLKGVNSNILDLKVSGKDTGGDLAIFEQTAEEVAKIFAENEMQIVGPPLKLI